MIIMKPTAPCGAAESAIISAAMTKTKSSLMAGYNMHCSGVKRTEEHDEWKHEFAGLPLKVGTLGQYDVVVFLGTYRKRGLNDFSFGFGWSELSMINPPEGFIPHKQYVGTVNGHLDMV